MIVHGVVVLIVIFVQSMVERGEQAGVQARGALGVPDLYLRTLRRKGQKSLIWMMSLSIHENHQQNSACFRIIKHSVLVASNDLGDL